VIGTADGVETATALIRDVQPDLVFMDIEMTEGNAFDLLNRLQPIRFHIIFVTAFDNHAVRAFRYNAIDYLLKPVNIRELCAAVNKLSGRQVESGILERVKGLLDAMQADPVERKITVQTATGLAFIVLRDIVRLEAKGAFTIIHLQDRTRVTATVPLGDYESQLPESMFFRVHHSHIINLNKIKSYQKGRGGHVAMDDSSSIEVASRRRQEFLDRLLK
jgi:two-component system LytT family response regulator